MALPFRRANFSNSSLIRMMQNSPQTSEKKYGFKHSINDKSRVSTNFTHRSIYKFNASTFNASKNSYLHRLYEKNSSISPLFLSICLLVAKFFCLRRAFVIVVGVCFIVRFCFCLIIHKVCNQSSRTNLNFMPSNFLILQFSHR